MEVCKMIRVGDIVRKSTHSGTLIGPYMKVEVIVNGRAYCHELGKDNPNVVSFVENLQKIQHCTLPIPKYVLNRLKCGEQRVIHHPATTKWMKALTSDAEIAVFYCVPEIYKAYFKINTVYKKDNEIYIDLLYRL